MSTGLHARMRTQHSPPPGPGQPSLTPNPRCSSTPPYSVIYRCQLAASGTSVHACTLSLQARPCIDSAPACMTPLRRRDWLLPAVLAAMVAAPSYRRIDSGLGLLLHRPPQPGSLGAVGDALRAAAGEWREDKGGIWGPLPSQSWRGKLIPHGPPRLLRRHARPGRLPPGMLLCLPAPARHPLECFWHGDLLESRLLRHAADDQCARARAPGRAGQLAGGR